MPRPLIENRVHSKESFAKFKKKYPSVNIEYASFVKIMEEAGKEHSKSVLEGNIIKLPNRLGLIGILAKPLRIKNFDGDKIILPINWKETKRIKKVVYHTNPSTDKYFQVKWYNFKIMGMNHCWKFNANRLELKRKIKDYMLTTEYLQRIDTAE